MSTAYIALGANLGNPRAQVENAIRLLNTVPSTHVVKISSLYHSAPVGYTDQPDFINAVVAVDTQLHAEDLLTALQSLEHQLGRVRTFKNAPRTIDLDILLYDNLTLNTPRLILPHPRMTERTFVMIPLQEIAPHLFIAEQSAQSICLPFTPAEESNMLIKLATHDRHTQ